MGRKILVVLLVFVLLICLLAAAYPLFASWYSRKHQSDILLDYQQSLTDRGNDELASVLAAAREYNRRLAAGEFSPLDFEENGYYTQLSLDGREVMGCVEIPRIHVSLPVYHGTGASALQNGAGHMEQTSLPVGGADTHAVISAHTGMASNPMFTDLELLTVGDIFCITVLGEKLVYRVDQIKTVLPEQTDDIRIIQGGDFVTLLTCTPYGVNTHRLLVRGQRVPPEEAEESGTAPAGDPSEEPRSVWYERYRAGILAGLKAGALIVMAPVILLAVRKIRRRGKAGRAGIYTVSGGKDNEVD